MSEQGGRRELVEGAAGAGSATAQFKSGMAVGSMVGNHAGVEGAGGHTVEVQLASRESVSPSVEGGARGAARSLEGDFASRHIGPNDQDLAEMLKVISAGIVAEGGERVGSLEAFSDAAIPSALRMKRDFRMSLFAEPVSEQNALERLRVIASKNKVWKSFIGCGYYGTFTPAVIQRNILENPGWYTQYTPYQAEIAQGRLEALLNFQTMVCDLTALPVANASLLDEATAAAEAMSVCLARSEGPEHQARTFIVAANCHPQTIAVIRTRAEALGVQVLVKNGRQEIAQALETAEGGTPIGVLLQYPSTDGIIEDYRQTVEVARRVSALVTVATDLLALTQLTPPGEWGADIAVGSAQRFGVPFGFGGPHAAFFAVREDLKRLMPGRLVGISKDAEGNPALRLALQTREQHIRRERATSNICTAQVLLAIMASMYAVYHGPRGLDRIARKVRHATASLVSKLTRRGLKVLNPIFFDTIRVAVESRVDVRDRAARCKVNLLEYGNGDFGVSCDETTSERDIDVLVEVLTGEKAKPVDARLDVDAVGLEEYPQAFRRTSAYLTHKVFNSFHSETEFLRYLKRLEARDLSLAHSMIPLGSCTMKLNATSEMLPVTWPEFGQIHPFAPIDQAKGYVELFKELERALREVTGFDAVSLQPNSGAQGEYAGLLAIRGYHRSRGDVHRTVCLIPRSAHGTNPASAVMAGLEVVAVECDSQGNIDVSDLRAKVELHKEKLAALMVTYPSTHGVFEGHIKKICTLIHKAGGQVYMDGANLNALVGLVRPADLGADVCHINLHKTFCIPHGGGGPGMGPIAVKKQLAPFLPSHPSAALAGDGSVGPVSAAPWGSSSILVIPWVYMKAMGAPNLRRATQVAIANANYIATRLRDHYPVLYRGQNGLVAHECILDLRHFKKSAGIEVEDVAKRLMDYGFHAPTVSWPVAGTLMVEPTESESKAELDRFCDAMISIREEIRSIEQGAMDRTSNPLKGAPHTVRAVSSDTWSRPYSRQLAAFPVDTMREYKFWPAVARIDGVYGDKNLVCTCPSDW